MKKKKQQKKVNQKIVNKEIEAEDWCFLCKDGGELMFCDYGNCLKVYHPDCVGKDESFSETGEFWTCDRHSCSKCQKVPKFLCFCCPISVCEMCFSASGFAQIKGDNGLCDECLELVLLGEEEVAYDINGEKIDFGDRDTYEGLFKEYWEIVKEEEGLTMDDVYAANTQLKKNKHKKRGSVSVKTVKRRQEDELIIADSDEEIEPGKPLGERKKSKKQEFIGWGSKPLIEFLKSIGKDTTEKLSHYEVDSVIKGYIRDNNLVNREKKYRVCCDEKLYSLFRRRSLAKGRIFHLLEAHFVENLVESEEDVGDGDSDQVCCPNKDENGRAACKKQRTVSSDVESDKKEIKTIVKQSSFASIVAENIKLIYLRRSLVEELFKEPESFEGKVVGSFVRVKTDPKDYLQRNSHQLLPVTGVEKSSTGEIFLRVSLMPQVPQDLYIRMLSDSDFTEEECQDLREKMESGVLKKLSVVELEERARIVHEDITKHAIKRELVLLQNRIDCANEKGRRRELFHYICKREQLKKPSEQERLLKKVPNVIPELVELKAESADLEID